VPRASSGVAFRSCPSLRCGALALLAGSAVPPWRRRPDHKKGSGSGRVLRGCGTELRLSTRPCSLARTNFSPWCQQLVGWCDGRFPALTPVLTFRMRSVSLCSTSCCRGCNFIACPPSPRGGFNRSPAGGCDPRFSPDHPWPRRLPIPRCPAHVRGFAPDRWSLGKNYTSPYRCAELSEFVAKVCHGGEKPRAVAAQDYTVGRGRPRKKAETA
jgi:hypothetical protein